MSLLDTEPNSTTGRHAIHSILAGVVAGKVVDVLTEAVRSKVEEVPWIGGFLGGGVRFMGAVTQLLGARFTRGGVSEGLMLSGITAAVGEVVRMLPDSGGPDDPATKIRRQVSPEAVFAPGMWLSSGARMMEG